MRCWRGWSRAESPSTATSCRAFPANLRRAWRGLEEEISTIVGGRFNLGSPKQIGDMLFGQMGLPGGKKTATGAWSTTASVLEDLAAEGHELPRASSIGDRSPSSSRLIPTPCRATSIRRRAAYIQPSRWLLRRPGVCRRLSLTCRTYRSAPRRAEDPSRLRRPEGHKLISADYSQIELACSLISPISLRSSRPSRTDSTFTR